MTLLSAFPACNVRKQTTGPGSGSVPRAGSLLWKGALGQGYLARQGVSPAGPADANERNGSSPLNSICTRLSQTPPPQTYWSKGWKGNRRHASPCAYTGVFTCPAYRSFEGGAAASLCYWHGRSVSEANLRRKAPGLMWPRTRGRVQPVRKQTEHAVPQTIGQAAGCRPRAILSWANVALTVYAK